MDVIQEVFEQIMVVLMTKMHIFTYDIRLYDVLVFMMLSSVAFIIIKYLFD